jgi:hypothetical protein
MLTIRPDQLESFKEAAVNRFEDLMVEHLKKFFPAKCEAMGKPQLREMIHYGIERAEMYGITAECDVSVFLDVMLVMGRDFDLRGENAWAVRILNERDQGTPTERVMGLRDATLEHLR